MTEQHLKKVFTKKTKRPIKKNKHIAALPAKLFIMFIIIIIITCWVKIAVISSVKYAIHSYLVDHAMGCVVCAADFMVKLAFSFFFFLSL